MSGEIWAGVIPAVGIILNPEFKKPKSASQPITLLRLILSQILSQSHCFKDSSPANGFSLGYNCLKLCCFNDNVVK